MVKRNEYITNFDGLRAYAVFAVLFYHLKFNYFAYGWLGVQIFFVLSGFLITGILLKSKDSNNYFITFYTRRTLRIFPIYYLTLAFILLYATYTHLARQDFGYYIFYLQNYKLGINDFSIKFPEFFNHTWSLAVEEQFYLFWPLVVKFVARKTLLVITISCILLSILSKFVLLYYTNTAIVWSGISSNLDMLCGGALLSILMNSNDEKRNFKVINIISMICTFLYFIGPKYFNYNTFLTTNIQLASMDGVIFLIFVLPLCITLIKFLATTNNKLINILFSNPFISYLGKISYGIYLFHYISIYFIDRYMNNSNDFYLLCLKVIFPVIIAVLSYQFIERKILSLKNKYSY